MVVNVRLVLVVLGWSCAEALVLCYDEDDQFANTRGRTSGVNMMVI